MEDISNCQGEKNTSNLTIIDALSSDRRHRSYYTQQTHKPEKEKYTVVIILVQCKCFALFVNNVMVTDSLIVLNNISVLVFNERVQS
jgi:hypothetical protein